MSPSFFVPVGRPAAHWPLIAAFLRRTEDDEDQRLASTIDYFCALAPIVETVAGIEQRVLPLSHEHFVAVLDAESRMDGQVFLLGLRPEMV